MAPKLQLCYITDRRGIAPAPLLARIEEAVRAGVDLVQIREKDLAVRALVELAQGAVRAARETRSLIVVNDRLDVALVAAAAGVHLGRNSLPIAAVRSWAPKNFLVGASCHSLEEALEAEQAGADYIVLGPVFPTLSKPDYGPPLGLERFRAVAARVKIPALALGGVTVERVRACLEAGAAGIAGISVFQQCPSMQERVRELRAQFPQTR